MIGPLVASVLLLFFPSSAYKQYGSRRLRWAAFDYLQIQLLLILFYYIGCMGDSFPGLFRKLIGVGWLHKLLE